MPNKTDSAMAKNVPPKGNNITKTGANGIYGANPAFPEYKQSMGPDTIPFRFAESGIGSSKRMTNSGNSARPSQPTMSDGISSATMLKGKNKYDSVKGSKLSDSARKNTK
jgi:hypothetical protein